MKKVLVFVSALIMVNMAFAQSAVELAKQQKELNDVSMQLLKTKPTKSAKKEAKRLISEGWAVPAGENAIAEQITRSQLYAAELMTDEEGGIVKRYMMQTGQQTAGSYNAGYAAARAAAQTELAAMLKTEIVSAMQQKIDNSQQDGLSVITIDKFNERSRMIVDQTLSNSIPMLVIYRRIPNNLFEVQVRIAFDKKELKARIKRNMQQELEMEGDKLYEIIDQIIDAK